MPVALRSTTHVQCETTETETFHSAPTLKEGRSSHQMRAMQQSFLLLFYFVCERSLSTGQEVSLNKKKRDENLNPNL